MILQFQIERKNKIENSSRTAWGGCWFLLIGRLLDACLSNRKLRTFTNHRRQDGNVDAHGRYIVYPAVGCRIHTSRSCNGYVCI